MSNHLEQDVELLRGIMQLIEMRCRSTCRFPSFVAAYWIVGEGTLSSLSRSSKHAGPEALDGIQTSESPATLGGCRYRRATLARL